MKIEIKVPQAGESVTEAMIGEWFKEDGDRVQKDESLLEFETDKANQEFFAPESGTLVIQVPQGEVVKVGQVIGYIDTEAGEADADAGQKSSGRDQANRGETETKSAEPEQEATKIMAPSAKRIVAEERLDPASIDGTGKGGRITKEDALKAAEAAQTEKPLEAKAKTAQKQTAGHEKTDREPDQKPEAGEGERVVPMSMMRRRIAERLVSAQKSSAILTTFNEIDMSAVMDLRQKYKDAYEKKFGVRLGFMSFFVKACVEALKQVPEINARIDENNIVYRDHYHIGVAVGSDKGLVVPVIRHADRMGFAEIENAIGNFAQKARDGKISLEDLSGGTFTISNGGIYGSLLSTPILNPPQSGILGMHKIEKRPVVEGDQVVVRPMMYVALSYDHRIVDGKGAVTFLVRIKECIEDPGRIMLEI